MNAVELNYRLIAIISRGLYIFYPSMVYKQKRLMLQTISILNKEIWAEIPRFIIKSDFKKSRAGFIVLVSKNLLATL